MNEQKPKSGLAIASMVLGIFSLICFGLLTGLPAIIMGHISHNRARKSPETFGGTGFAIAGLVMGYLSVLTSIILLGLYLPALAKAKEKAQSITCVNNLRQVGLSANLYALDHTNIFPSGFAEIQHELGTPKVLYCPKDKGRVATTNWSNLTPQNISYEWVSPGINWEKSPDAVLVRCPIHNHIVLVNGTVERGDGK